MPTRFPFGQALTPRSARAARFLSPLTGTVALLVLLLSLGMLSTGCSEGADAADSTSEDGDDEKKEEEEEKEDAIHVEVAAAKSDVISDYYSSSATLRPEKKAVVTARTAGVIQRLTVEEGDVVEEGQPLVILEDAEQRIARSKARALRDNKVREHERAERLHGQGLLSEEAHGLAEREASEAAHAADLAELELSRTIVRAPFSGTVLRRHVDVGATVTNGTEVYEIADLEPLHADVTVPERHVERLSVDQRVKLTADANAAAVPARIERIAPFVDAQTGTVKVTVAAEESPSLRPGSFVRVDVVTDVHEEALLIPRSAMVAIGRKRWAVYRLTSAGDRVERLEVEPGLEEDDFVEILSSEVSPEPKPKKDDEKEEGDDEEGDGESDDDEKKADTDEKTEKDEGEDDDAKAEDDAEPEAPPEPPRPLEPGDEVVVLGALACSDGSLVKIDRPEEDGAEKDADEASETEDASGSS